MKKTLFAFMAFVIASLFTFPAFAHGASTTVDTSISASSNASTSALATGSNSFSASGAIDHKQGVVNAGAVGTGVGIGPLKAVTLNGDGAVNTSGYSAAGNLSLGSNATGSAAAAGTVTGRAEIKGDAHTVTGGPNASMIGDAEAITQTAASSGKNGLGISSGSADASLHMAASASQIKIGSFNQVDTNAVGVNVVTTGPQVNVTLGTGTTQINTQAAGNTEVKAKIGQ